DCPALPAGWWGSPQPRSGEGAYPQPRAVPARIVAGLWHRARLLTRGIGWTYAADMATTDRTPGQPAPPSRAESLSAHAEGSISEDAVLLAARERAVDIGAGAVTPAVGALLSLLTKLSGGKAVVEGGPGAGVSRPWLLSGVRGDGVRTP